MVKFILLELFVAQQSPEIEKERLEPATFKVLPFFEVRSMYWLKLFMSLKEATHKKGANADFER